MPGWGFFYTKFNDYFGHIRVPALPSITVKRNHRDLPDFYPVKPELLLFFSETGDLKTFCKLENGRPDF